MAASFDGYGGGFAYREDGSLILRLEAGGYGGAVLDKAGGTLDSWQAPNGRPAGAPRLCIPLDEFLALVIESGGAASNGSRSTTGSPSSAGGVALSAVVKCDGLAHEMTHGPNPQRLSWRVELDAERGLSHLGTSRVQRRGRANTDWVGAVPPAAAAGGLKPGLSGGIADALAMLPNLSKPSSRR